MFPCLMTDDKEPDICKGFFYKQSKHRFFKSWFADLYSIKFFVQFWEKKNFRNYHPYFKQPEAGKQKSF